jgi:uncharacterized protein
VKTLVGVPFFGFRQRTGRGEPSGIKVSVFFAISMTRPRCCYKISFCPKARCFRPEDSKNKNIEVVELTPEEAEALRLKNIQDLHQTEAARRMGVSQSTFQRVLSSAHKKVSEALMEGKTIKIIENKS